MEKFIHDLSVIVVGSAIFSCLAVFLRQPIITAYIVCGMIAGPWGLAWVRNVELIEDISHLGVTLLLFLAGLLLPPQKLFELFKKTALVTFTNALFSFLVAFSAAWLFQFSLFDCLGIGLACLFSSTILTVKLLPTTTLHQERLGASCIGVLILQDLLAVAVLAFIRCWGAPEGAMTSFLILSAKLALFIGLLLVVEYFILRKVMAFVDRLHEVLFILGLALCLGIASVSHNMGLFYETGAFFAGVVLARHPIARFIAESLRPLRDFFLVLFFFTLGSQLDLFLMGNIFVPALVLSVIFVWVKPWVIMRAFLWTGESRDFSKESGVRLGQLSEFSLLTALLAFEAGHISHSAAQLIQLTTILTFIVSSYLVVFRYPTPIGVSEKLIQH